MPLPPKSSSPLQFPDPNKHFTHQIQPTKLPAPMQSSPPRAQLPTQIHSSKPVHPNPPITAMKPQRPVPLHPHTLSQQQQPVLSPPLQPSSLIQANTVSVSTHVKSPSSSSGKLTYSPPLKPQKKGPMIDPKPAEMDSSVPKIEGYADLPPKSTGLRFTKLLPKWSPPHPHPSSQPALPVLPAQPSLPSISSPVYERTVVEPAIPVSKPLNVEHHPEMHRADIRSDSPDLDKRLVAPSVDSINPKLLKSTGLKNLGNTCYMNCVLQSMLSVPQLTAPFFDGQYASFINYKSRLGYKGEFAKEFANLVRAMLQPDSKYIAPIGIKRVSGQLRPDSFAGFEQQDCQEFLTFLLDCLHEDLNVNGHMPKNRELVPEEEERREQLSIRVASAIEWERYLKGDTSLIVDLFQGQYLSQLKCLHCQRTSTTYNAFSSLSLPIVGNRLLGGHATLKGCFDEFVKPEVLDGENAWFCPHCNQKRKASKTLRISRLPPVLIIHLKRFKRSKNSDMNKLETPVDYPLRNLDLTKYWPQLKQHEFNAKESELLQHLPNRGQNPPFIYDLRAVTMHQGSLKGGHYTAVAEKPGMGWFLYDDSIVVPVKEQAAISKNAYVLVYQRRM